MSEFTDFLPPELADIGLMAFADPGFAERLVEALRCLPPERAVDARTPDMLGNDSVGSEALALSALGQ
jgi:hypothetical protein